MRTTLSAVAFLILWSPLGAQNPASPAGPEAAPVELSKAARKAIDDKLDKVDDLKNWKVAVVTPEAASCNKGAAAPAIIQGDLNGDARPDYAVLVQAGDRVQLLAVLNRVDDAMVVEMDGAGTTAPDGFLGIEKQGTPYADPDTHLVDYFTNDTLVVYRCGQSRTAYFWTGLAFQKVVLPEEIE